ncbi:MAG: hypothetical protein U5K76_01240 [Woeseiaceae bacterium]|nr:hypothetical protein [Woeseiaceae bacterium]
MKSTVRLRFYIGVFQRTQYAENDDQAARIVADARCVKTIVLDADGNVRTRREYRVEMGAVANGAFAAPARTAADDVADVVDTDIGQPGLAQQLRETRGALCFPEGGRRNLCQLDQVPVRTRFDVDDVLQCGSDRRLLAQLPDFPGVGRLHRVRVRDRGTGR